MAEILHVMPKPVRDDDRKGFFYEEKYVGNLYEHQGKYVYFSESSYDTYPKEIIEQVVSDFMSNHPLEVPAPNISKDEITTLIDEQMNEYVNRIVTVVDGMGDKIAGKVDLTDLQKFRDTLNMQINEYIDSKWIEKNGNPIDESTILQAIQKVLPKIKSIESKNAVTTDDVASMINDSLVAVHTTMTDIISEQISAKMQDAQKILKMKNNFDNVAQEPTSNKISIAQIMMLKESGMTVEEIAALKKEGLI